ncbi:MAG: uracil-DNA glycosylase [Deltaproteobacteria bacterium]|nr:uracil-DNA glycosylase [Deltaproteobacteria bacterium]
MLRHGIPQDWARVLAPEIASERFASLERFVAEERARKTIFPPEDRVFTALARTPLERVEVVLVGQDPYHDEGQAHGLAFSVEPPTKPPPSLRNMYKELESDLGIAPPTHGDLSAWADRGVLLLNAVLTVVAHEPASHAKQGWEEFTDAVLRAVNDRPRPAVFALWGGYAKKKGKLVDRARHEVVENAHPSPLSAKQFMGSKPFSRIDAALAKLGRPRMDWRL